MLVGTLVGMLIFIVVSIFDASYVDFERQAYDLRYWWKPSLRGREGRLDDVVIVDIDERSLATLGRFQDWPRYYHAQVADYVNEGGAKAVGFDIFFIESDGLSPDQVDVFHRLRSEGLSEELRRDAGLSPERAHAVIERVLGGIGYDAELAEATARWGNVYHAMYLGMGEAGVPLPAWARRFTYDLGPAGNAFFLEQPGISLPYPTLARAARGVGYANVWPDPDGTVRAVPLFHSYGGVLFPAFAVKIALDVLGVGEDEIAVISPRTVAAGPLSIPVMSFGRMLIDYQGYERTFRTISYSDVLLGQIPADYFNGKIVLVGASARGLADLRPIPIAPLFSGVEIHATIVHNIINGEFIHRAGLLPAFLVVVGLLLVTSFVSGLLRPLRAAFAVIGVWLLYLVLSQVLFETMALWLEVVRPVYCGLGCYMSVLAYRYVAEERRARFTKRAFQHYVTAAVVDRMLANPELLRLGGEKRELTVLFSDIRAFTTISEKLSPEELVQHLSEYLTAMTDLIFEHEGMLDKYVGDEIMAVYGATPPPEKHAYRACLTGVRMMEKLRELHRKWEMEGKPLFNIGIGVNTGDMIVGNMGSRARFDYTVTGDNVNLGSRLEGINKLYGTNIIISEFTQRKLDGGLVTRELDKVRVKGKLETVIIYELMGEGKLPQEMQDLIEQHQLGLEAYKARDWARAKQYFTKALEIRPGDGPSREFSSRCDWYRTTPPPDSWDGAFNIETK
jgi:adenylate cyclase